MPRKKKQITTGRTDFPKTPEAVSNAWEMKGLLEKKGVESRLQWMALAQMGHESGFYSSLTIADNNFSGIKWGHQAFLSRFPKGTPSTLGTYYLHFPTKDDYVTTLLYYLTRNDIGQGKAMDATDIPNYSIRLKYNGYYEDPVPKYTPDAVKWIPVLQRLGIVPKEANLAYAATDGKYYGQGYKQGIPGAGNAHKPPSFVSPADLEDNYMASDLPQVSFIQSAARQAKRLLPGTRIGSELESIAKKQLQSAATNVAHPKYIQQIEDLRKIVANTTMILQDPYHDSLLAQYDKTKKRPQNAIKIGEDAPATYNGTSWIDTTQAGGYNTTPFMSRWQIPSSENGLPREFQWLQNGFKNQAIPADTPAANLHAPAPKAAPHHEGAKGKTHRTADAINGDSRQVVINVNAPMYQVDSQVFQNHKDALHDLEPKVKTALVQILNNAYKS